MTNPQRLSRLADVPVEIEAAVVGPVMRVSEILALRVGSVIATPLRSGDSVEVFAGKASIGAGELSSNSNRTIIRMVRLGSKG